MFKVHFYEGKAHFEDAYVIREAVFMQEQGFLNEIDEIDDICTHCVAYYENQPVACGRFYKGADKEAIIGRIAVLPLYRGKHLGNLIMESIEQEAVLRGYTKISLSAQCQARAFYEKLGYVAKGEEYLDEHCPHIHMEKKMM